MSISVSATAYDRFLPLAAKRGTTVSRVAEQSLRAMLFPGGPNMSMPNLTAFPPDAKETRALKHVRDLAERYASNVAGREDIARDLVAHILAVDLIGYWQRVRESAAWHDANDAAQAADLTPRKLDI